MKNNLLFLLAAITFALTSCGTTGQVAYNNSQKYSNSIYYTPTSNNSNYLQEQQELERLQQSTLNAMEKSTQYTSYDSRTNTETIYVGNSNEVNIDYNPNITYTIVDDSESYQARLRKFDSPTYTINIETDYYDYYYPWWDIRFSWGYPYYSRYTSYYSWRWNHSWYDPWYDPWYYPYNHYPYHYYAYHYGPYPGYYYPGFYHPSFYPSPYYPGYYPGHKPHHKPDVGPGPGAKPSPGKGTYYGKRTSGGTYVNVPRNGSGTTGRVAGSATRRNGTTVSGNGTNNTTKNTYTNNNGNNRNNGYTRRPSAPTTTKNTAKSSTQYKNNNSSSYNRTNSSSTYRRSVSSSSGNYSNSSGSRSYNSSGSSGSSSSGGGSAYRR